MLPDLYRIKKEGFLIEVIKPPILLNEMTKKGRIKFVVHYLYFSYVVRHVKKYIRLSLLKDKDLRLVMYKDNWYVEAGVLDYAVKMRGKGYHINTILIEEGMGIYGTGTYPEENRHPIALKLLGISSYCMNNPVQGMNPAINEVWCYNNELFRKKRNDGDLAVIKEENEFDEESCECYVGLLSDTSSAQDIKKLRDVKYIFLTQPFADFDKFEDESEYIDTVSKILELIGKYGDILIKQHPRDKVDYSCFKNDNVFVCNDAMRLIPFEGLQTLFNNPRIITVASSCATHINYENKPIVLYPIFCSDYWIDVTENRYLESWSDCLICKSLEELKGVLALINKKN